MQTSLDDLEGAADQNRRLRSQLGNRASRVETAMDYQEGVRIDLKQILSRYEDADAIEAFNDIVQQETAFQAALSVTGKVSQLSILDSSERANQLKTLAFLLFLQDSCAGRSECRGCLTLR